MFTNQLPESMRLPGVLESAASVRGWMWTIGIVPSSVGLYSGVALNTTGRRTSTAGGGAAGPGGAVPVAGAGAALPPGAALPVPVAGGGGCIFETNTYLFAHAAST